MNEPLSALPPDLDRLLEAERPVPPPPPGAHERVLARVQATTLGQAASNASVASAAGLPKAASLLLITAALAGGAFWLTRAAPPSSTVALPETSAAPASASAPALASASVAAPASASASVPAMAATAAPASAPAPTAASASAPAPVSAPAPASPTVSRRHPQQPRAHGSSDGRDARARRSPSPPPAHDLSAERRLLERARQSLAAGDAAAALAPLRAHRATFGRGLLAEERESLWIKALVDLNRPEAAAARAARFRRRWPHSIHLPAVEAVLYTPPGDGETPR